MKEMFFFSKLENVYFYLFFSSFLSFFFVFLFYVYIFIFFWLFFDLGAWTSAPNSGYRYKIWSVLVPGLDC